MKQKIKTNCPNCGAPIEGYFCEYCDSPLYTPAQAIEKCLGKVCHVWYEDENHDKILFDITINEITPIYEYSSITTPNGETRFFDSAEVEMVGGLRDIDREEWQALLKNWEQQKR